MKTFFFTFVCLILFITSRAQDFIKHDYITLSNKQYNVSHISYGKTSLTKYIKVFTCNSNLKDRLIKEITRCYKNEKYEYSEIYIIFIPNLNKVKSEVENKILVSYLNKIDDERMQSNLSTVLIKFKYDYKTNKYEYLTTQPKNSLKELQAVCNRLTVSTVENCLKK